MKYDIKWFHGLIAVSESVKTPLVGYEQSVAHKLKVITHTQMETTCKSGEPTQE